VEPSLPRPRRRRGHRTPHVIDTHVAGATTVPRRAGIPNARTAGIAIGLGRTAIGAVFFAAPITALRIVGADSATAARVTWLSRMTAARDGVLGVGTARSSASGRGAAGWLIAGAVADAVDAAALTAAMRERRAGGAGGVAMIAAAAATSALGAWAALASLRRG
jgi:hypothetical protein